MLFNSNEFIFGFLPVTLLGFYVIGKLSRGWALRWLILASLVFYASWRSVNVLIIAPSILINFALGRLLLRLARDARRRRTSIAVLLLGIAANVAFLGYFKYANFFLGTVNDVFGANLVLAHIVLPLGISFITFQKIAFLIDVQAGRVVDFAFQDYCLFVLFFPQLIAGPIVHYREVMPQFHQPLCRFDKENIAVALTLFFLGLFKKAFLADNIAPLVSPIYEHAAGGGTGLVYAWIAAIGFTLQIYFDFSGYSDMALGLARFFGIRLPPNFDSPLRATSIIDFWLRWHMTLTRFLTAYIYNPLSVVLTRRRMAKGRPGFGGRNTTLASFVFLLMFPTLVTMFVSGLWHGAGYLFVLWGLLHGLYLTINHGWRVVARRFWPTKKRSPLPTPMAWLLTFVAVVVAMVFFRSPTLGAAFDVVKGMAGLNGVALAEPAYGQIGPLFAWLREHFAMFEPSAGRAFALAVICWIFLVLLIALVCPNTLQILAPYEPALGVGRPGRNLPRAAIVVEWRPSVAWAVGMSVIAAIGVLLLGAESEFLYWQF
jgi:D-alanyl-lipoteichoic acid acyltransferase DltB (MBOAT superfamily)